MRTCIREDCDQPAGDNIYTLCDEHMTAALKLWNEINEED